MGAHTLGKADILNSGFHGMWVNNEQVLRDLHNQKKGVKFHTWGVWTNLGLFHTFSFLLVLIHTNMQRKVYFVWGGGTT